MKPSPLIQAERGSFAAPATLNMSPQHVNGSTARRASNSEAATEACVPRSGRCSPTNEANREIRFEDWQQLVAYHQ